MSSSTVAQIQRATSTPGAWDAAAAGLGTIPAPAPAAAPAPVQAAPVAFTPPANAYQMPSWAGAMQQRQMAPIFRYGGLGLGGLGSYGQGGFAPTPQNYQGLLSALWQSRR